MNFPTSLTLVIPDLIWDSAAFRGEPRNSPNYKEYASNWSARKFNIVINKPLDKPEPRT